MEVDEERELAEEIMREMMCGAKQALLTDNYLGWRSERVERVRLLLKTHVKKTLKKGVEF